MSWDGLEREIDLWAASRRSVTLWWRDDDAVAATDALRHLLQVTERSGIPIALAVIPATVEESLAAAIADRQSVTVLQHGYAHANHAAPGMRAVECGGVRPLDQVAMELARGQERLAALFGPRFLSVLVPPWNRIEPALLPRLPQLGYRGVSAWGARDAVEAAPGLRQVNTHVDPILWRKGRLFGGADRVTGALAAHLAARRAGRADPDEPTGLLTHHLVHDHPGRAFLEELAGRLSGRRGLRWVAAAEAFGAGS